jgi:hypothetical protein
VQPSELVGHDFLLYSQLKALYLRTTVHTRGFGCVYDEMRESEMKRGRGISWGDEPEVLLESGIQPRLEENQVWDFAEKAVEDSSCVEYSHADTRFLLQKECVVPPLVSDTSTRATPTTATFPPCEPRAPRFASTSDEVKCHTATP